MGGGEAVLKDCASMTFLMATTDSEAPGPLCRAGDVFRNVPVTHYAHNWAVNRGQITPVAMGTTYCPRMSFFRVESPFVERTVVFLLELQRLGSELHKPRSLFDHNKYQNNQDQTVLKSILV